MEKVLIHQFISLELTDQCLYTDSPILIKTEL